MLIALADAHPVIAIGIIFLAVIFLLLFLLYRERSQVQQPMTQHVIYNNYGSTINNHIVRKSSDTTSVSENAASEEEETKTEADIKIAEPQSSNNFDASNLRHRRVPTHSNTYNQEPAATSRTRNASGLCNDQTGDRVFSEPSFVSSIPEDGKAFFEKHADTSPKKVDGLDMGETKSKTVMKEGIGGVDDCQVPSFEFDRADEAYHFKVDKKGCKVRTKYCKVFVPPDAIVRPETIIMTPRYKMQPRSADEVIITPYVTFKTESGREPEFTKDVTISLYSGYSAVNADEPISVQVLWRKDESSSLKCISEASMGHEKFISFSCSHFCGFCLAANQSNFHSMRRHYFYAGYVRPSTAPTRIFHWMIFEDCPALFDQMTKYMKDGDNEVTMDPESFHVDYDYTLQIIMKAHHLGPVDDSHTNIKLTESWGSRVNLTHQFEIKRMSEESTNANLKGKYAMFALHNRQNVNREIRDKHFYYEWKEQPTQQPSSIPQTMNVYGGVGFEVNMSTSEKGVRQQESVESSTSQQSSGYGSPSVTNRTFSLSEGGRPSELQVQGGVTDVEEPGRTARQRLRQQESQDSIHPSSGFSSPPVSLENFDLNDANGMMESQMLQVNGFNDREEARVTTPKAVKDFPHPREHSTPARPTRTNLPITGRLAEGAAFETSTQEDSSVREPTGLSSQMSPDICLQGMTEDTSIQEFPSERDSGVDTFHTGPAATSLTEDEDRIPADSLCNDSAVEISGFSSHAGPEMDCSGGGRNSCSEDNLAAPTSDSPNGSLVIAADHLPEDEAALKEIDATTVGNFS